MKTRNRIISIFSALMLTLPLFAGCASHVGGGDAADTASTDTPDTVTEAKYTGLEARDFEGADFTILNRAQSPNYNAHPYPEIEAETQNGETLNDAVWLRNLTLSEKYNINLKSVTKPQHGDIRSELGKAVSAGDAMYDAAFPGLSASFQLATDGMIFKITDVPFIDPGKPWWRGNILESTSFGGKSYFIVGDMNVGAMNSAGIVYFNKQICSDYALESPYDLVDAGSWTLEAMTRLSAEVTHDLDGDGVYTEKDCYGTECSSFAWQPLFYGSGQLLIGKDADDMPYLDADSEKNYNAISAVVAFLNNKESTFNVNHTTGIADLGALTVQMFRDSQALFFVELIYGVPQFRDMNDDFGIIPVPKANEKQEMYSSYLHNNNATAVVVPLNTADLEMSGMLLEDMAFYSSETISPAFYDIMLKSKYTRDEDSARMLDIILNNFTVDLALVMSSYGIDIDSLMRNAATKNETAILSTIAANADKYKEILNKAAELLK
ncbi:MAG: hypothetical protein GX628_02860 [Clostridiales bacterium]|nr:hypothetical protein [Clostridiales bacterium]